MTRTDQEAVLVSDVEQMSTDRPMLGDDIGDVAITTDLWSAAFREAVESLGDKLDIAKLNRKHIEQLFRDLEEIDKEATQESAFLRGVNYLHSIQVPLERFKLALDLASPLTSLEPTAMSVFGVVSSVTAVSLSYEINRITNQYLHRLLSALRALIWSLRNKLGKCLNRSPTLMTVTLLVRRQIKKTYIRYCRTTYAKPL